MGEKSYAVLRAQIKSCWSINGRKEVHGWHKGITGQGVESAPDFNMQCD